MEGLLRELKAAVSALRGEVRAVSDALISDRLRSVERALARSHLELYAAQAEGTLRDVVRGCVDEGCVRRESCEERFLGSLDAVLKACREGELEEVLVEVDGELREIEERLDGSADGPCGPCYRAMWSLLSKQRGNLRRILDVGAPGEAPEGEPMFDVNGMVEGVLKPLSHPARLSILLSLYGGRAGFSEFSAGTGMRGGHLTFHIDRLLSAGLIAQDGRKGDYVITSRGVEVIKRLQTLG